MKSGFNTFMEFEHKHSLAGKLKNVVFAWGLDVIWTVIMIFFLSWMFGWFDVIKALQNSAMLPIYNYISFPLQQREFSYFFMACIFAPLWEEALFRYFPLEIARHSKNFKWIAFPVIVGSALIFGWLHGSVLNIIFQGVSGILLGWVYLKNDSYWSSVLLHSLWNTMIIYGLPFLANI